MQKGKIIVIEGLPGCGKTTFCKSYASSVTNSSNEVVVIEEWVDEKILADYLTDMPKKATSFQYEAQRQSVFRLQKAVDLANSGKTVLIDRGLIGNRCFAEVQFSEGYISADSMKVYREVFTYDAILTKERKKNIHIETWYLQCDVETALARIKQRNRNGESGYSTDYLIKLKMKHDELLLSESDNVSTKVVNMNRNLKISAEGLIDVRHLVEVFG